MTERTLHIIQQALRVKLGVWFDENSLTTFLAHLKSQGVEITESGE